MGGPPLRTGGRSAVTRSIGILAELSFENIACTQCGCVCDDLRIAVDEGRIVEAERACDMASAWYLAQETRRPPAASIAGEPTPLDAALSRAGEILAAIRAPLIYGLSRSSTEGQRAAVALADCTGGHDRHDCLAVPRSVDHGLSTGGRIDVVAGRSPQPV